ncbi:cellobiose dehydrogenase [Neurospora crassa OR74A]|uniref:Cellobiose dehydrogenase n=1 Tax=Neurospora crassa (strain ATCC 24698 / 74-OR23-1A / CBS 708.71 / DSM 1257 / FGSC 987) TaxID=367110 RepID=Q7S0Y1_NEUCR|nr:cellobiose dehydrogenase [Neurospora crassa OR74A]EAA28998.1 cellobiose dehydrogenase [Neurospora crassa OR74A]|eukprot:XP_958234.1 cellobiose dehydrogenase [Neurospora crassa OR74A]
MKVFTRIGTIVLATSLYLQQCSAQYINEQYTDPVNKITLSTWRPDPGSNSGGGDAATYAFGLVLPPDALTKDANEYIGLLRCDVGDAASPGWCGVSHGQSGQMTQSLLLMAWASKGQVFTSFRYASGYNVPGLYTGNATLTQISATVNSTQFELIYRCQDCFAWNQGGSKGSVSTSSGLLVLGRAAAKGNLQNPTCPDKAIPGFHDNGFGQYGAPLEKVPHTSYSAWASLATKTTTADCSGASDPVPTGSEPPAEPTSTAEPVPVCTPAPSKTYDYIIVGAGAGGIPIADKLSEAGKSVLLIEKGPPSTGRWKGTMKPEWLQGTNLTRFDVPGLCNQIWVDSAGIACTDTDQMAGCVLGGGTAVNAGLWWKPHPQDWNYNFPEGWKSRDTVPATNRVFGRIPGTWHPSQNGKLYRQEGFNVLASGLSKSGWKEVIPNDAYNQKNHTFGHSTFMFAKGERGGPLATYLVTAVARKQFTLWTNVAVRRAVRNGSRITGVELECLTDGGLSGTVNVTPNTGRVIFAAGTFGSAKLLLRSGIGPTDQLEIVKGSTDGPTFISKDQWINLPVGYNLMDHLNTDLIITHPDVVFYDFYEAWNTPIEGDKSAYLQNRSGILAQAAPNIGPLMWDELKGSDNIIRTLQWTARVEGSDQYTTSKHAMTLSQYLGRGVVSRGRMAISSGLDTNVAEHPYLHNDVDKQTVIQGIKNLQAALNVIPNLSWVLPPPNTTVESFINNMIVSPSNRRSNHWMGTAKLGKDDGRTGGSAVVDLNTKVYGTDNLFVVDASIFPGMTTGNPSAMIVIASEHAAQKILALKPVPSLPGGNGKGKWRR